MRPSTLAACRGLLEGLRAGTESFDGVARVLRPALEHRAERFLRVWKWSGQAQLGPDDLVQEMLLELWRAIDRWDPVRTPNVVKYVDAQIGRAATKRLRRVAGYPDPRRRTQPVRQVHLEDLEPHVGTEAPPEVSAYDVERRKKALLMHLRGLDRHVLELVLDGATLDEAARRIYSDPDARLRYRMDCEADARRMVGASARRATNAADAIDAA
jgi:DNA-directed RNA polymerase specialized sigma24 family protein